ncbi:hypothetical protein OUZ56_016089 [Daphnia magna]|uniref:Uncharacterized protein n=1 Tax=Daphnia magna TaxID=35525 RepID=A0ABR0APS0_9CRUS|nr:hypothetical protein OUZ56_016089 [Daphnia magna]
MTLVGVCWSLAGLELTCMHGVINSDFLLFLKHDFAGYEVKTAIIAIRLREIQPRSDAELPRLNSDLRAREDKYRRSEFSLGNSASDLGLWHGVKGRCTNSSVKKGISCEASLWYQ